MTILTIALVVSGIAFVLCMLLAIEGEYKKKNNMSKIIVNKFDTDTNDSTLTEFVEYSKSNDIKYKI